MKRAVEERQLHATSNFSISISSTGFMSQPRISCTRKTESLSTLSQHHVEYGNTMIVVAWFQVLLFRSTEPSVQQNTCFYTFETSLRRTS